MFVSCVRTGHANVFMFVSCVRTGHADVFIFHTFVRVMLVYLFTLAGGVYNQVI